MPKQKTKKKHLPDIMVNTFRGTLMENPFSKVILTVEENLKGVFLF